MPIAFDAATDGGSSTGTSKTFSHTCTGSNRLLFVFVIGDVTNDNVTGVTYAGTDMTRINGVLIPSNRFVTGWYLVNPLSGANNVVVSASVSILIGPGAASYTGAKQTQVLDTDVVNATATVTGGTVMDASVTTTVNKSWVVGFGAGSSRATTAGTGMTARKDDDVTYGWTLGDSNADVTPAGSKTLGVTLDTSGDGGLIIASFSPAIAARPASSLLLMGSG